ncbi:MAG: 2-hydroxyacyl-CoA dehydratase [Pseudohongiella sp.]|nr:2-hydroxyacyl-CoA dehydratase [Pseudohongiella sp.]
MMAFRQVRELLLWVMDFHQTLADKYSGLAREQPDELMRMTLEFLAGRELEMHRFMSRYMQEADPALLGTWLIDTQDFVHPRILERIPKCPDCRDVQDIQANAMASHQTLKDMYRLRSELAQIPTEARLFDELAQNQDAEMRLQASSIGRLDLY